MSDRAAVIVSVLSLLINASRTPAATSHNKNITGEKMKYVSSSTTKLTTPPRSRQPFPAQSLERERGSHDKIHFVPLKAFLQFHLLWSDYGEKQGFDFFCLRLLFSVRYCLSRVSVTVAIPTMLIKLEKCDVSPSMSAKSDG